MTGAFGGVAYSRDESIYNEKAKEQLQIALEYGYQRKSGKIYDCCSGSWQPPSKCRYKLQIISDPELQLQI